MNSMDSDLQVSYPNNHGASCVSICPVCTLPQIFNLAYSWTWYMIFAWMNFIMNIGLDLERDKHKLDYTEEAKEIDYCNGGMIFLMLAARV